MAPVAGEVADAGWVTIALAVVSAVQAVVLAWIGERKVQRRRGELRTRASDHTDV